MEQIRSILKAGGRNFDIIADKLAARKRNFDLMMQDVAFLGNPVFNDINGLLNNSEVTTDTTLITTSIGALPDTSFNLLVSQMIGEYIKQTNYSELKPNRLIMPYSDFLSLTQFNSVQFPMMSKLEYLENVFKKATMSDDFKILPSPYAEASRNGIGKNIYMLYRKDPNVLVLDLPVPYSTTAFNTIDDYVFYNVGYGQVGGVRIFRPQEVLYFSYTPTGN